MVIFLLVVIMMKKEVKFGEPSLTLQTFQWEVVLVMVWNIYACTYCVQASKKKLYVLHHTNYNITW